MATRQDPAVSATDGDVLTLEFSDVTGSHTVVANDIQPTLPAGAVARATANRFSLPENSPFGLHDDQGAFLDDEVAIGDQVKSGARLWVSPKAHLG